MKRDDTKKNFTALSGNDLATVLFHYLSFPCFFAFVTISEVCRLMRYRSVTNALFRFFCSENRNFLFKIQNSRFKIGDFFEIDTRHRVCVICSKVKVWQSQNRELFIALSRACNTRTLTCIKTKV